MMVLVFFIGSGKAWQPLKANPIFSLAPTLPCRRSSGPTASHPLPSNGQKRRVARLA